MQRLYPVLPPPWSRLVLRNDFPTYQELLELLAKGNEPGDTFLLGDHGDGDSSAMDDPLFGDVVRRIVARLPPPSFSLGGETSEARSRSGSRRSRRVPTR